MRVILPHITLHIPSSVSFIYLAPQYLHQGNLFAYKPLDTGIHNPHRQGRKSQIILQFYLIGLNHMRWIPNIFSQLRHMKHIVEIRQQWRQSNPICYRPNPLQYLKGSNKSRSQLWEE
ncbi:hypothetical protein Lalb_Chr00c02g0404091 [Lupinus albus]|uniref:Uncharacterized protein n=1 Tax=Lupinus albus TaxID=3870 RepID=A0A6A4NA78_LUPAL|nr:hypothetical protein Lalb_Chr00c02g0404091 [Lupinus albus]